MGGGVQLCGLLAVVGETSLEGSSVSAGLVLVRLEPSVEIVHVDLQSFLCRQFHGHLDRESVGVVEPEHGLSVEDRTVAVLSDHLVESPQTLHDRLVELQLLVVDVVVDEILVLLEFGVRLGVVVDDDLCDLLHERLLISEFGHVSGGPPDEPPEDVSLTDLGGNDTVSQDECGRSHVIGDDPECPGVLLVLAVLLAGEL